jgi:hypothetical protein
MNALFEAIGFLLRELEKANDPGVAKLANRHRVAVEGEHADYEAFEAGISKTKLSIDSIFFNQAGSQLHIDALSSKDIEKQASVIGKELAKQLRQDGPALVDPPKSISGTLKSQLVAVAPPLGGSTSEAISLVPKQDNK